MPRLCQSQNRNHGQLLSQNQNQRPWPILNQNLWPILKLGHSLAAKVEEAQVLDQVLAKRK